MEKMTRNIEISGYRGLALLLDPEKADLSRLPISETCHPDYFFVGGSTGGDTTEFIQKLKSQITNHKLQIPVILFPGNASQFSPKADAVWCSLCSPEETRNIL